MSGRPQPSTAAGGLCSTANSRPRGAEMGHFRQIDPLPTLSACPLRSDRVRTFAPQRIDAVCQLLTHALQQTTCTVAMIYLLNHLVGGHLHDQRHCQAERLRRLEIDGQLDLVGCSTGRSAGLAPFRTRSEAGQLAENVRNACPVGHHAPGLDRLPKRVNCWQPAL
jgi:hypothetical protein